MTHNKAKKYDVFLSHNGTDKKEVEQIALRLEERGVSPFLDKWHLVPGEPWQEALEEALDKSATCAIFLGSSGLGPWENEEMRSALEDRVRNKTFRVIPVLLPRADASNIETLPRFLRRLSWVDFRVGVDNSEALEHFIAGILGYAPGSKLQGDRDIQPLLYAGIIHPLPPAPSFIGRKKQLDILKDLWDSGKSCVVSLVGFGGAGKTAIASEFVNAATGLPSIGYSADTPKLADGCFVWSFYVDQDINSFLREAYRYFSNGQDIDARSGGAIYRLVDLLNQGGRYLMVLDGLERVQHSYSDSRHGFGQIEDPLLRQLVSRLAAGIGQTLCLVTSRFPLSDIQVWSTRNRVSVAVENLDKDDAHALIRHHGITADDAVIDSVLKTFGLHALTLDHLCTYVVEFCLGDLNKVTQLDEPNVESVSREERRLAQIFKAYEAELNEKELALLSRFCVFRFGTTVKTVIEVFTKAKKDIAGPLFGLSEAEVQRTVNRLLKLHLLLEEGSDRYTTHPAVKDHFYRLFRDPKSLHSAVRDHIAALTVRPGVERPQDKEILDEFEELIYHAISAGSENEAAEIYKDKLGGDRNLGFKLGEYARGLRILKAFSTCPSPGDMATYLRSSGALKEALTWVIADASLNRYPLLFLMGALPNIDRLEKSHMSIVHQANLLMGKVRNRFHPGLYVNKLDCVVLPHLSYHLGEGYRTIVTNMRDFLSIRGGNLRDGSDYGFRDNMEQITRSELSLAEIDRQKGDFASSRGRIERMTQWILLSGSQEHLCLFHLSRARLERSEKQYQRAHQTLTEALQIARDCGFTLYHIDILNEMARVALAIGKPEEAEGTALCSINGIISESGKTSHIPDLPLDQLALMGAAHPQCMYVWGEAEANHLLGWSFLEQGKEKQSRAQLSKTLSLRQKIDDPRVNETEKLLLGLASK